VRAFFYAAAAVPLSCCRNFPPGRSGSALARAAARSSLALPPHTADID